MTNDVLIFPADHKLDIWSEASVVMDHGCVLLYLTMDAKSDSQEKVIIVLFYFFMANIVKHQIYFNDYELCL